LAGVCSLCGILVFAVPITVISKTFDAELAKIKQKEELGLGHVKQIKEKLIHAYRQGENRKSLYLNESGVSEKDREDTMVFLGKFLHGYEEGMENILIFLSKKKIRVPTLIVMVLFYGRDFFFSAIDLCHRIKPFPYFPGEIFVL
jgi:hypothetical protein